MTDPEIARSPDDRLSEAALAAVRAVRFRPGRQDGRPVKVRFAVPLTFRLPAGDGVDRGAAGDVRHWGVDLARLSDGPSVRRQIGALPQELAGAGAASGTAEVRYTIGAAGVPYAVEVVKGEGPVAEAALAVVRSPAFRTAESARPGPGGTWTGTFGLSYRR